MSEAAIITQRSAYRWQVRRLGELIEDVQPGFATSKRIVDGAIQLRMNNVTTRGTFDWSEFVRVPSDAAKIERFALKPGDVLFNNTNSVELVGKTALFVGHPEPVVYSNHFTRLRTRDDLLEPAFLAYFLRAKWSQKEFERICNRWIGQAAVQRDKLFDLKIPLPSVGEQRRIVATLDRQMALAERASASAHEQQSLIDNLVGAMLREAFHGIIPLCIALNESERPPANWRWARLTDIARLESGHTPNRRHPEWWGGEIPWLALPDIRELHGKVAMATAEHTNDAGIANSSARVLPKDTVALSRTASVGFVTIMSRPMATSQDFVNWVCGPELEPWFLVYLLMASRNRLLSLSSGAIHKTIYMPTVEAFRVCIPDVEMQRIVVKSVREQLALCERTKQAAVAEAASIATMPQAFLRQVFGEAA